MEKQPIKSLNGSYSGITATGFVPSGQYTGVPYRWNIQFNITSKVHSYVDVSANIFNSYDATHIKVGDWVGNGAGQAVRIISINTANSTFNLLDAEVEDVDYYNIQTNQFMTGFDPSGNVVVFEVINDHPIIDPLSIQYLDSPQSLNIISRFKYFENAISALSQFANDLGYITETSATVAFEGKGDLSALSQFNNDVGYITETSAQTLVESYGYITETSAIALANAVNQVSALSQLTNDAGFITETSATVAFEGKGDLSALSQFNNDVGFITEASAQTLFGEVNQVSALTQLNNDAGFITQISTSALGDGVDLVVGISGGTELQYRTITGIGGIDVYASAMVLKISAAPNPTTLSQLTNDAGFITETSAQELVTGVSALSQFTNDLEFITSNSAQTLVESYGYITETSATLAFEGKGDLSALSQFNNDVGFITEASAQTLVNSVNQVSATSQLINDSDFVTIDTATSVISQLFNDAGFITEASANSAYQPVGSLSALSQFNNDAGYITETSAIALANAVNQVSALSQLDNDEGFIVEVSGINLGNANPVYVGKYNPYTLEFKTLAASGSINISDNYSELVISAPPVPYNLSQLENDADFITETSANAAYQPLGSLSALSQFTNDVDYITVDTATSVISQLANDAGYVSAAQFVGTGIIQVTVSGSEIEIYADAPNTYSVTVTALGTGEYLLASVSAPMEVAQKAITGAGAITVTSTADAITLSAAPNPTQLSDLDNDVGFITEASAQSLVESYNYITEVSAQELVTGVSALSQFTNDLGYITETSANAAYQPVGSLSALSQFDNDAGFITEASAVALVNSVNQVSATSQLTNDSGFVTVDTATSVISQLVNNAGYVSAAQFVGGGVIDVNVSGNEIRISAATVNVEVQAENIGTGEFVALYTSANKTFYRTLVAGGAIELDAFTDMNVIKISAAPNPTALTQLTNDAGFITEASAIALVNSVNQVSATSQLTNDSNFITVDTATSVISQLANDAGYVSAAQFVGGGIIEVVNNAGVITISAASTQVAVQVSSLGTGAQLPISVSANEIRFRTIVGNGALSINTVGNEIQISAAPNPTQLGQLGNDVGYITEASAEALFNSINQVSAVSQLINNAGYITAVSAEALLGNLSALGQFINNQGFVSAAQIIGGGIVEVSAKVDGTIVVSALSPDLSNYVTIDTATSVISQLVNDAGYITETSANAAYQPLGSLSALSQFDNDLDYVTVDTATSVISQLVNNAGYITETSAQNLIESYGFITETSAVVTVQANNLGTGEVIAVSTSGVETRYRSIRVEGAIQLSATPIELVLSAAPNPTNLSQLINDADFITEASAITLVNSVNQVSALSQLTNNVGYITEASADMLYQPVGSLSSLSQFNNDANFITIDTATSVISQLANDAGYVSAAQFVGGGMIEVSATGTGQIVVSAATPDSSISIEEDGTPVASGITTLNFAGATVTNSGVTGTVSFAGVKTFEFRINFNGSAIDAGGTPVQDLPPEFTLITAATTYVIIEHTLGVEPFNYMIGGFSVAAGNVYRWNTGVGSSVNMETAPATRTTRFKINIQFASGANADNSQHALVKVSF